MKIAQTMQNSSNFIVRKSSVLKRERERFHTLIWRPGVKIQNLESPGLSKTVDSTVIDK